MRNTLRISQWSTPPKPMAAPNPTKPGYYWAQWLKAAPGTRDAAELTPSDEWQPVQVFENALDDQHPEYLMVEVGGVEKAQSLDCFAWGPAINPTAGQLGIKALEWGETSYGSPEVISVAGVYRINGAWNGGWSVTSKNGLLRDTDGRENFATLEAAKAAAQADFEARIRSALIPTTSPAKGGAEGIPSQDQMNQAFYIDVCRAEDRLKEFISEGKRLLDSLPDHWHDEPTSDFRDLVEETEAVFFPGSHHAHMTEKATKRYGKEPTVPTTSPAKGSSAADQIIGEIEARFPNWRTYRDLIDCIDCTLHELRSGIRPASNQAEGVANG